MKVDAYKDLGYDPEQIVTVDETTAHQFEEELPPFDRTFIHALHATTHDLPFDLNFKPELTGNKAWQTNDKGVFKTRFGGQTGQMWTIIHNWTTSWSGKLPPGYCSISYFDDEVAILGPYMTIRTCWSCHLTGWREKGVGNCLPGHACPSCGNHDWFGKIVQPDFFEKDVAIFVADKAGRNSAHGDKVYNGFRSYGR